MLCIYGGANHEKIVGYNQLQQIFLNGFARIPRLASQSSTPLIELIYQTEAFDPCQSLTLTKFDRFYERVWENHAKLTKNPIQNSSC